MSGVVLGLLSLPHCAAMCGPLAAYACTRSERRASPLRYQLGRTLGYGVAGALCGHLGRVLRWIEPGGTAVMSFSVIAAIACFALAYSLWRKREPAQLLQLGNKPKSRSILSTLLRLVPKDATAFGAITVLLPCGVLAAALLGAVASGSAPAGAMLMIGFASSSGVAVLAAGALARVLPARSSNDIRRWLALALVVAAVALVARPVTALVVAARTNEPAALRCH